MPSDEKLLLGYFTGLLPQCKSSKTSCEEGKGKVSIRPDDGEDVCFFIFNKANQSYACRILKIDRNAPTEEKRVICDCLIFLGRKGSATNIYEEMFCVVELKGSDLEHAMKQVLNTYKHLWKLLLDSPYKHKLHTVTKKAYIYKHGDAPKETKDKKLVALRKELESIFGSNFAHSRNSDIGPFLRK